MRRGTVNGERGGWWLVGWTAGGEMDDRLSGSDVVRLPARRARLAHTIAVLYRRTQAGSTGPDRSRQGRMQQRTSRSTSTGARDHSLDIVCSIYIHKSKYVI